MLYVGRHQAESSSLVTMKVISAVLFSVLLPFLLSPTPGELFGDPLCQYE